MKITKVERVTTSTRTVTVKDGPTIDSDKTAGKRREFQVERITITESSVGSRTIMCWGYRNLGGVKAGIKRTYAGIDCELPKWLDRIVSDGFNG